ncbi:hypothetical protein B0T14DRAFT_556325 [Immersiella caudata]|uniref:HORMA domain-containing protein n=1 Tax=Immersiella caudata TaxID=314043 RepID=A0AA39WKD3_9PEZI|nr:hypothetical protein B0T14DRAFT_556325 [Immersiella caudata]
MSKARGAPRQQATESPPVRDFALCKVAYGAVLSQILYARQCFPPSNFQSVPLCDLLEKPFEDLVRSGSPLGQYDPEVVRDQDGTVFLRDNSKDYNLTTFLALLTTDIFPLIEKKELVKFRINFLSSPRLESDSLLEYYTIVLKYEAKAKYGIDVWRASTISRRISDGQFNLWNLGDYLSRLPPWKGPVYCSLAFHAKSRPIDPFIGIWKYDHTDFDDAKLQLEQRSQYSFQRIACLTVAQPGKKSRSVLSRPKVEDAKPGGIVPENEKAEVAPVEIITEARREEEGNTTAGDWGAEEEYEEEGVEEVFEKEVMEEMVTVDQSADVDDYEVPSESDNSAYEPQSRKKKAAAKGKGKAPVRSTKPIRAKPRNGAKKTATREQPPSPPTTKSSRANTSSTRSRPNARGEPSGVQATQVLKQLRAKPINALEKPRKIPQKTKRKAKQPLQMFSDPASNMAETQDAVRESQSQLQSANPGKRQIDHGADTAAHIRAKRFRPGYEASSGQLRMIDGIVVTSDVLESSELSSPGPTPQMGGETTIGQLDKNHAQTKPVDNTSAREESRGSKRGKSIALRQNSLIEDIEGLDISSDAEEEAKPKPRRLIEGVTLSSDEEEEEEEDDGHENEGEDEFEEEYEDDDEYEDEA